MHFHKHINQNKTYQRNQRDRTNDTLNQTIYVPDMFVSSVWAIKECAWFDTLSILVTGAVRSNREAPGSRSRDRTILLPHTPYLFNSLIIGHTDGTETTDFKTKTLKNSFSLFKCFALLLSVLSSLLVNEFPDSSDNPSNKPMAYEQFKEKNSANRMQRQTCLSYAEVPPVLQELKKQSLRSKTPCGTLTSYFSPPPKGGDGGGLVFFT